MSNEITITLTGQTALDYIQKSTETDTQITKLYEELDKKSQIIDSQAKELSLYIGRERELLEHNKKQAVELLELRTKTTRLATDPRLTHDIAMAKDSRLLYDKDAVQKAAETITTIYAKPHSLYRTAKVVRTDTTTEPLVPKKHKSRLSVADIALLDGLARKPFRSNCMVDQFAAKYNLSPRTVITYIKSHSHEQYTLVLGADIKKSHIWENASIVADKLYFTLNDGRY